LVLASACVHQLGAHPTTGGTKPEFGLERPLFRWRPLVQLAAEKAEGRPGEEAETLKC
jgi:hypothetical protein